MILKADITV